MKAFNQNINVYEKKYNRTFNYNNKDVNSSPTKVAAVYG